MRMLVLARVFWVGAGLSLFYASVSIAEPENTPDWHYITARRSIPATLIESEGRTSENLKITEGKLSVLDLGPAGKAAALGFGAVWGTVCWIYGVSPLGLTAVYYASLYPLKHPWQLEGKLTFEGPTANVDISAGIFFTGKTAPHESPEQKDFPDLSPEARAVLKAIMANQPIYAENGQGVNQRQQVNRVLIKDSLVGNSKSRFEIFVVTDDYPKGIPVEDLSVRIGLCARVMNYLMRP